MKNNLILKKKEIDELSEHSFVHPLNSKAIRHTKSLGDIVGLSLMGIHLVRVEPGDETTQHHNHECSDEFIYILRGSATLELGSEIHELESGDFIGFPAGGETHSMINSGSTDLVYLVGGNRPDFDCCNYPKINKKLYRVGQKNELIDNKQVEKVY